MQWDGSPTGGFTTGEPWLPLVDPAERNVADQRDDPGSMLNLVRELIALRRELPDEFELLDATEGLLAFRRGAYTVAVNTTAEERPAPTHGELRIRTAPGSAAGRLAPHAGAVAMD